MIKKTIEIQKDAGSKLVSTQHFHCGFTLMERSKYNHVRAPCTAFSAWGVVWPCVERIVCCVCVFMLWWSRQKGHSAGSHAVVTVTANLCNWVCMDQGESQGMEWVCGCVGVFAEGGLLGRREWEAGGGWARLEVVIHQRLEARAARPQFFSTSSSSSSSCFSPSWDLFLGELQGAHSGGGYVPEEEEVEVCCLLGVFVCTGEQLWSFLLAVRRFLQLSLNCNCRFQNQDY